MPEPVLITLSYDRICANPYQHPSARRFHGDEFNDLVESIRVNGVRQPPPARLDPADPNRVQLQSGHRRLAAAKFARPAEPFTVLLKEMSELEMFEGCVEENLQREGLNDIERAELIEAYKKIKPDATNADMARVFKLKDPASITNLRKLLKLPAPIQTQVAENKIPDAIARQLVGISAINEKTAKEIANKVAGASKSDKQAVFQSETRALYWNKLARLGNWSLDWLKEEPVTVERDLGEGDHLIGACAGCVFNVRNEHCARAACRDEKQKLYAAQVAQRVSAKLKIPVASPDETTFKLFSNNYGDEDNARTLLNARKEIRSTLRLAPYEKTNYYNNLERLLGAGEVTLVTTDKALVDAYFAEQRARASGKSAVVVHMGGEPETDAERAQRVAAEKKELAAKRTERSRQWKSKYDAIWLIENASKLIGAQLQVGGDFLVTVESEFCVHHHTFGDVRALEEALTKEIKQKGSGADTDARRRQHIALNVICGEDVSTSNGQFDFVRARRTIQKLLSLSTFGTRTEGFGVTLPDGWDIPTIHHTAFNCWHCGVFAGNTQEKLTKRDIEEDGWIDEGKAGVFCSLDHKMEYLDKQAVAAVKVSQNAKSKNKRAASSKAQTNKASTRKAGRPKRK